MSYKQLLKYILCSHCLLSLPSLGWTQTADTSLEKKHGLKGSELTSYLGQTTKGTLNVALDYGVGVGLQNRRLNLNSSNVLLEIALSPRVGYFLTDQWLMGLHFDNQGSWQTINYNNSYTFYSFSTGPFTRLYLRWGLFAELKYAFGQGKEKQETDGQITQTWVNIHRGSAGIGFSHFWLSRLSLDLIARYNLESRPISASTANDRIYVEGFNISAGITVKIGK